MEKPRSKLGGLDSLAKAVAIPRDHKPVRVPTFPALERTSTLAFTDTRVVPVANADATYALVTRDPAFPVWTSRVLNPLNHSFFNRVTYADGIPAAAGASITLPPPPLEVVYTGVAVDELTAIPLIRTEDGDFCPVWARNYGWQMDHSTAPNAGTFVCGVREMLTGGDVRLAEYRTGAAVSGNVQTGNTIPIPEDVVAYRLESAEWTPVDTVAVGTFYFGCTTTHTKVSNPLTSPISVQEGGPGTYLYPVSFPVEYTSVTTPWQSVRCNAAAALFTNVTSVMNKEGTVNAGRLTVDRVSPFAFDLWENAMSVIHPKDRYFGALENGLYTFTLPEQGSEVYREVQVTPAGGSKPIAVFDMRYFQYYNAIIFSDLANSASAAPTNLALTVDRHIEFRTSSVLFPLGFSTLSLESYHVAQMALVQSGVFYENPTHLGVIANVITAGLKKVAPYVYPIIRTGVKAGAQKVLNMAAKKLGDFAQSQMTKKQPTTKKGKPKPAPKSRRRQRR